MLAWARSEPRIGRLATGHYAGARHAEGAISCPCRGRARAGISSCAGSIAKRIQSYFLYDLSQEVLGALVFPLGDMAKDDTRCAGGLPGGADDQRRPGEARSGEHAVASRCCCVLRQAREP
ncbi:MAG: hypothetical protein ACKO58_05990 [Cyanobium sp.]